MAKEIHEQPEVVGHTLPTTVATRPSVAEPEPEPEPTEHPDELEPAPLVHADAVQGLVPTKHRSTKVRSTGR